MNKVMFEKKKSVCYSVRSPEGRGPRRKARRSSLGGSARIEDGMVVPRRGEAHPMEGSLVAGGGRKTAGDEPQPRAELRRRRLGVRRHGRARDLACKLHGRKGKSGVEVTEVGEARDKFGVGKVEGKTWPR